jgi:hypothetical protein
MVAPPNAKHRNELRGDIGSPLRAPIARQKDPIRGDFQRAKSDLGLSCEQVLPDLDAGPHEAARFGLRGNGAVGGLTSGAI